MYNTLPYIGLAEFINSVIFLNKRIVVRRVHNGCRNAGWDTAIKIIFRQKENGYTRQSPNHIHLRMRSLG